jgi:hypothetical protein
MMLNPRPQAGSSALGGVAAGAPMAVSYRGAFSGPNDNWADGWTALSTLGYLAPAAVGALDLSIAIAEGSVQISFPSQSGTVYQVQSRTELGAGTWERRGRSITGTGSSATFSEPIETVTGRFYRVVVE